MRRGSSFRGMRAPMYVVIVVAGTAAEVALDRVAYLGIARRGVAGEEVDGGDHQARGAEAALERVFARECALDRMELAVLGEAFDGHDLGAVGLDREDRAGLRRAAVDEDGAGAALTGVAADVCAGEPKRVAEELDEKLTRFDVLGPLRPVDRDRDRLRHFLPPTAPFVARRCLERRRVCMQETSEHGRPLDAPRLGKKAASG